MRVEGCCPTHQGLRNGSDPAVLNLSPAFNDPKLVDDFALFGGVVFILGKSAAARIVVRHRVDFRTRQNGDL